MAELATQSDADPAERQDSEHCTEQVRRGDKDRWLTALFAREGPARNALMALYAWNLELARIPDTVSEPLLGQMRLQWWRETVEGILADAPRRQPIARALHRAVRLGGLERSALDGILTARERDVAAEPPADLAALEVYAAATGGALAVLAGRCLTAGEASVEADAALCSAGTAYALAGLMRAIPWHAERRRVFLPLAELRAAGVLVDNLVHHSNPPGLYDVIRQVAERAAGHLAESRRQIDLVAPGHRRLIRPALLIGALAAQDLRRLRTAGFDPENARAHAPVLLRQIVLLRAAMGRGL